MRLRRVLLCFTLLVLGWSLVITVTGGFAFSVAGVRVSSRNVWNPLLLAAASAIGFIALSGRDLRRQVLADARWVQQGVHQGYASVAALPVVRRLHPAVAVAIFGVAVQLLQWLGARPMWVDEEMIALNIRDRSFAELAGALWLGQSAPLGWLQVQRSVLLLLDGGEHALRFVPIAFGAATLAAAAWIGCRWMGATAAAVLVLLCFLGQAVAHYSLELKHYSADIFFALLLPALVVWVSEADRRDERLRRAGAWWVAATLGQWCAYGAALVAPASALALCLASWRRDGRRSALLVAAMGAVSLLLFGIHYWLSLRFTTGSGYLREYWAPGFPPASAGVVQSLDWLTTQARPLAMTPGGSGLHVAFWAAAACGFLYGRPRLLAGLFAAVPLSACALALIRVVPLHERLGLWAVPALYAGVALALDAGIRWIREGYRGRVLARPALGAAMACLAVWVSIDIAHRGWRDVGAPRPADTNHLLDDRTAVRWLFSRMQPGDAVLTTILSLPAVWWYGGVSVAPPVSGALLPGGAPILEVSHDPGAASCEDGALGRALTGHDRALVYFGFGFDDGAGEGFSESLLQELRRLGRVSEFRRFAGMTRAAVVELGGMPRSADAAATPAAAGGCLGVRPAVRW